jgi:hypothetical protein
MPRNQDEIYRKQVWQIADEDAIRVRDILFPSLDRIWR